MEDAPADDVGDIRARIHPNQPKGKEQRAENAAVKKQLRQAIFADTRKDKGKLQSDDDEHQTVQDEVKRIPEAVSLQTNTGREQFRAALAKIKPAGNHGERSEEHTSEL